MAVRKVTPKPIATDGAIVGEVKQLAQYEMELSFISSRLNDANEEVGRLTKLHADYSAKIEEANRRIVQHITSRWEES